jgi:hypothetical protein
VAIHEAASLYFSRVLYGYVLKSQFAVLNRARVYGLLWQHRLQPVSLLTFTTVKTTQAEACATGRRLAGSLPAAGESAWQQL